MVGPVLDLDRGSSICGTYWKEWMVGGIGWEQGIDAKTMVLCMITFDCNFLHFTLKLQSC